MEYLINTAKFRRVLHTRRKIGRDIGPRNFHSPKGLISFRLPATEQQTKHLLISRVLYLRTRSNLPPPDEAIIALDADEVNGQAVGKYKPK